MKKSTKIALIFFIVLLVAVVPLYFYTRPNITTPENAIQIKGSVNNPANITLSQLKAYTPITLQVTISSSNHPADNGVFNYTGVPLKTLLEQVQVSGNATSIYIQASDGYPETLQLSEVMNNEQIIIAYEKDGAALAPLKNGVGEGPYRLIIGTDQFAYRFLKGVAVITVA